MDERIFQLHEALIVWIQENNDIPITEIKIDKDFLIVKLVSYDKDFIEKIIKIHNKYIFKELFEDE